MFDILEKQAFGITNRIKKRDFSGNTGLAVKNSIYQFATNIISKFGSLIFVYIILMRYLSEELFGLYSLALATILLFSGFSDLGVGTALIRYISSHKKNSRGYVRYLAKLRVYLTVIVCIALLTAAHVIAEHYYKKPIFLALIAGILFIALMNLSSFFNSLLQAENNFRVPFYKEIIFQATKLVFIPLIIFFFIAGPSSLFLFWIILGLSFSYLLASIFLFFNLPNYSGENLGKKQRTGILIFLLPLSLTALSGTFFGYIDTIMLGRFVSPEFIAYYQAAFSLISSAIVLVSFSGVLFPIFSRLDGKRLQIGLKKSILVTIPLSILLIVVTWFISPYLFQFVNFITGRDYTNSVYLLRLLAVLLFTDPLIGIFSGYWYSRDKTKKVAYAIILSTVVNILLNIILITALLRFGMMQAVFGAAIATVISRFVYLGLLIK